MNAGPEGRIQVTLGRRGGAVAEVRIASSRPQLAQRLLADCTPEQAADRVGRLFTLCGNAQRVAAEVATEAAQGRQPDPDTQARRAARVRAELAMEHAWRLLFNWPEQVGRAPDMAGLMILRQATSDGVNEGVNEPATLRAALERVLAERLLGEPPADWLRRDAAGFEAWRAAGATPTAALFARLGDGVDAGISQAALLPPICRLDEATLGDLAEAALTDPDFCARPVWQGRPAETGAIARRAADPLPAAWIAARGRGVGARMLARLVELARLADAKDTMGLSIGAARIEGEAGVAGVETSRGLLLHVVRLAGGQVADYRIVAPTEWNFHPHGPLAEALSTLPVDDRLADRARQTALSLDPCVEYGIDVEDV